MGHYGATDGGDISNTGNMRMLENRTNIEEPRREHAPETRLDTTEKEVVTDQPRPSSAQPAVVGLGISGLDDSRAFSEQDVHDGLHEQQYHEYEDRRQRLREVERQLAILDGRYNHQAGELREEAQDLRSEVKRLEKLLRVREPVI